ncbi:hypothetical protein OHA18_38720 [Kribbella sp. NBC_00709]|uniref:hypothetical protein n=1 Tax=Kribbella sp. NBC_00709 TaxID=2975972 RepID=UPI002E2D82B1|nr:hypothetical protein [Kribbella sp. NBC_00709]
MPFEEKAVLAEVRQPPPALPDGSMPTYGGHAPPSSANGEPSWSPFGWGTDLDRLTEQRVRTSEPAGRALVFVAFVILYGGLVSALLAAIAVRVY